MQAFAAALPAIRGKTAADLAKRGLCREKVLASVVRLLERTLIRVGNDEYARTNGSFGLTTLRDTHVDIHGSTIRFQFRGKSGKRHEVGLEDRRLARVVKQCRDLPGQALFQYLDDKGRRHNVSSTDVNAYLKAITGEDFTAKDFRTWFATVLACTSLSGFAPASSPAQAKKNVVAAIEAVAGVLGNTRSVCRKAYIHPAVLEAYESGLLARTCANTRFRHHGGLRSGEMMTLALLRKCERRPAAAQAA